MISIPMAEVRNSFISALSTIIYMRAALLFLRSDTLFFNCVSSIFQLSCCCRHCYWCWKIWKELLLDCFLFIWMREMFCYLQPMSSYIQRREIGNPRSAIPNCRIVSSWAWHLNSNNWIPVYRDCHLIQSSTIFLAYIICHPISAPAVVSFLISIWMITGRQFLPPLPHHHSP